MLFEKAYMELNNLAKAISVKMFLLPWRTTPAENEDALLAIKKSARDEDAVEVCCQGPNSSAGDGVRIQARYASRVDISDEAKRHRVPGRQGLPLPRQKMTGLTVVDIH